MESEKQMHEAIKKLNGSVIEATDDYEATTLTVCEFVSKLDRTGTTKPRCSTNLYVKNFPSEDFSEEQLRSLFEPFG